MAKYTKVNAEHQRRYNQLFTDCHVFWAFSNEQFEEGKTKHPLESGDKYISIGSGGYMPKSYWPKLEKGLKEIKAWKKQAMKDVKAEEAILYELNNYECFYTGNYQDAMEALAGMGYTEDQVRTVYRKYQTPTGEIAKANEAKL